MSQILCLNIGNTHIQSGLFQDKELETVKTAGKQDWQQLFDTNSDPEAIIIGSVNDQLKETLMPKLMDLNADIFEVEKDIPIPVGRKIDPDAQTGVDRLLNAAAAFDQFKQACIVVDIGTAITIDLIDGEGTFHGGAITPGLQLMLDSMSAGTKQLPTVEFEVPTLTFGDNTESAMRLGTYAAVRGQLQFLAERYSEAIGYYPKVIATGGSSELIFQDDPLVERILPSLTLEGLALSYRVCLEQEKNQDQDQDHEA